MESICKVTREAETVWAAVCCIADDTASRQSNTFICTQLKYVSRNHVNDARLTSNAP